MVSPLFSPPASSQLHALFENHSANGVMGLSDFHKFLIEVQQDIRVSEAQAKNLMEAHLKITGGLQFLEHHFLQYLFDTQHNLAINTHIHHDMTLPLSHYFIFTGHNSYLTGNQLSSASSEKPIAKALRKGVRVIELDLWPNSQEDNVLVLHGRTLTPPVEFKKCILTINEDAFVKSDFPVIITLEDHLPPKLQAEAAKALSETFGAAFFYPEPTKRPKEFPSPESLKGRIVISTKPPQEHLRTNDVKTRMKTQQKETVDKGKIEKQLLAKQDISNFQADEKVAGYDDDEESPPSNTQEDRCFPLEYMRIITILAEKPKGKVSAVAALQIEEYAKRVSLSEPQFIKFAKSNSSTIVQFTCNNLLRIYPYGLRIDSSNYNPLQAWSYGAQMVAMNMQGYGKHLWVAQGFFRANGGCGYVKKPSFFLPESPVKFSDIFNSMRVKQKLKVRVCMGSGWLEQYGKRPPNCYTRVGIAGVGADSVMKKMSTVCSDELEFFLRVPELAVLRIEVHNDKKRSLSNIAGQTCLPVSELKPGYRVMPLCDKKGDELEFVRILFYFQMSFH